jgi:hypothetical protein
MLTEEGKQEADKARDAYNRRLTSAVSVPGPAPIDWATLSARFSSTLDVAALQKDYESFFASIPPQTYNESADKASADAKEAAWTGFASYCKSRVTELRALAETQTDHALHRFYRRSRVWQRFPGLYESLHHRARGTWDNALWANYISYKARLTALPWDPTTGDITESRRKDILKEVATRSGLTPEQVGLEKK